MRTRVIVEHNGVPIIKESFAIHDYPDSMDNPGSSYLLISGEHHLNREEVIELITRLQDWLTYKRLQIP